MSEHTNTTVRVPYQEQFIDAFLRSGSPQYHLLVAPPGTGKTHTACTIFERLAATAQANYVLVLAPAAALRAQWAAVLSTAGGDAPPVALDRQVFRELEASVPVGQLPWSRAPRVVIGLELLRHADVYEAVLAQHWDLVIVDECHRMRIVADPRLRTKVDGTVLLRQMVDQRRVQRLLLMTATPGEHARYLPEVAVTEWDVPLPAYRAVEVTYQPGADERDFIEALAEFLDKELVGQSSRVMRSSLLRQAESSIFCLEPQLQYWIEKIERSDKGMASSEESLDDEADSSPDTDQPWRDPSSAVSALRALLERLDTVQTDAKLDTLLNVIRHESMAEGRPSQVCIVTMMNRTAWYLHSALQSAGMDALRLQRELHPDEIRETIARFELQGGILVAVPSCLRGFELPEVRAVIAYDSFSQPTMEQVLGRFNRIRRTSLLTVFAMRRHEPSAASS